MHTTFVSVLQTLEPRDEKFYLEVRLAFVQNATATEIQERLNTCCASPAAADANENKPDSVNTRCNSGNIRRDSGNVRRYSGNIRRDL
jgi:hypothetical protein